MAGWLWLLIVDRGVNGSNRCGTVESQFYCGYAQSHLAERFCSPMIRLDEIR
ncbi:MAG: hypothetical protein LBD29_03135 [Treponema sp.]|nr:hypothetical protein [Treponema sp.]